MIFYDICSDYSLDKRDETPTDLWKYEKLKRNLEGQDVIIYRNKYQMEIHYLSCDFEVSFKNLVAR